MAQKYGREFTITFDGNYALDAYPKTGNLFDSKEHEEHLKSIFNGQLPEPIVSVGIPVTIYGGVIEREFNNGKVVTVAALLDTRDGTVVVPEDVPLPDDGELHLIKSETLTVAGETVSLKKINKNDLAVEAARAQSNDYVCDVKPIIKAITEQGPIVHDDYLLDLNKEERPAIPVPPKPKQASPSKGVSP